LTSVVLPAPVGPTIATVAERHVVERDGAANAVEVRRRCGIGDLLGFVEQLEHPLGRGDGRLEDVDDARRLDDRERELARVLDERDDVADAELSRCHAEAADDRDRDVIEVRDERQRGLDDPRDELRSPGGVVEALVLGVEHLDRLTLSAEGLHDGVPGMHLLDVTVERAGRCPLGDELLLRAPDDQDRDGERCRHGEQ
jgi:hypothetical protein